MKYCSTQSLDDSVARLKQLKTKNLLKTIIVDEKNKVLFCYVPKVASGNWKRIFLVLNGKYNQASSIQATIAHKEELLSNLGDFSADEILDKIRNYRSYIMVREPVERLLSAYINKIHFDYTGKFQKLFGRTMLKYTKQKKYILGGKWNVTFEEFIHFLTSEPEEKAFELHWERIHKFCHPCLLNYDYVGHYENLSRDASAIIKMTAPFSGLSFPFYRVNSSSSTTKSMMTKYFKTVTQTQLTKLLNLYKQDYLTFGYPIPKYLYGVAQRQ